MVSIQEVYPVLITINQYDNDRILSRSLLEQSPVTLVLGLGDKSFWRN